jgi:hypothetical protein
VLWVLLLISSPIGYPTDRADKRSIAGVKVWYLGSLDLDLDRVLVPNSGSSKRTIQRTWKRYFISRKREEY